MKEHTTDTSAVGELAVSNFITGPLLSPGGWPGKITGGECMGRTPASPHLGGRNRKNRKSRFSDTLQVQDQPGYTRLGYKKKKKLEKDTDFIQHTETHDHTSHFKI